MGDEIKPSVIKKTQDILGKFVKRPPLTEKLLRKPPFRFLHDIITTVIRETKFLDGLFNDQEMNSENVKDKESKIAFLQKVIDVVNLACGISLTVRPTKIVSGYEPEKTNELLQAIGKAIEKKVDSSAAIQKVLSKSKGSHGTESTILSKSQAKKEDPVKAKKATGAIKKTVKDQLGSTQNLTKIAPKAEEKDKKTIVNKVSKDRKTKTNNVKPMISARNAKEDSKSRSHLSKEKRKSIDTGGHEGSIRKGDGEGKEAGGDGNEKTEANVQLRDPNTRRSDAKAEEFGRKGSLREDEGNDRISRRNTIELGEEVEDAFPSLEPPVSERDAGQGGDSAKNSIDIAPKVEEGDKSDSAKKKNSVSTTRNEDTRTTVSSGQRMAISTPVLRPASVMANTPPRPRSSRPHAPRLRSALGGRIPASDVDKAADRTGKEIMIEQAAEGQSGGGDNNTDDVDEKEFLVEEARPPSPSLPPKEVKQQLGEGGEVLSLEGEKQGVLVTKILETKKELEAGIEDRDNAEGDEQMPLKRVEIEYEEDEMRRRRRGAGEIENLQTLVQLIARAAHPLGSLLGMVQGNVEAMRSDTTKWRNECENLMKQLREEEKNMELELEPLRSILSEVEQRVIEEREALSAAKVRVLKAEQRISVMLDPQGNGVTQGISTSYRVS